MIVPFQHIGVPVGLTDTNDDAQLPQSATEQVSYPVLPRIWMLGGRPEVGVDVPITAVFLLLFIVGAVAHMTIYQLNRKRGHKFLMSALLFGMHYFPFFWCFISDYSLGFCMARIGTCVLRIASVTHSTNISLAIAAQVFVAVGVIIIYIINLIFAQRMIRASHPHAGWSRVLGIAFKVLYALVLLTIIMLVTVTIQSFFTINTNTHRIDRDIQLYGVTCFAVLSFLPIPMVIALLTIPRRSSLEKFGHGRWRTKICVLLTGATLICFGASYRAATSWKTPVPQTEPIPAYDRKPAFYIANFGVEILIVYLYAILRVDLRFHVPNGASARKSYIGPGSDIEKGEIQDADDNTLAGEEGDKKTNSMRKPSLPRIYTEEETFDEQDVPERSAARLDEKNTSTTQTPLVSHPTESTLQPTVGST